MKFTEKEIQQIIREEYRAVRLEQLAKKKTIIEHIGHPHLKIQRESGTM